MAARTQEAYIGALVELAKYYHRSPADLGVEEIEAYLLHLIRDRKLAYATVNQASCAFRFLYRRVLGRPEAGFDIPMAKAPKRLPQILSREEVARLIDSARTLRGRTLLMTTYAAGLRVSEVCALQLGDIESAADRMCLKVRQGKGGKRVLQLPAEEFIDRFLLHVLPNGFKRIRHYGLLAPAAKATKLVLQGNRMNASVVDPLK